MMSIIELEDRISLKELVDSVSILGDRKDFKAQVQLFTEDAVSETFAGGKPILVLKGREEMARTFRDFLKNFDTVYHFNGQQVVTIDGNMATGTCYCLISLVGYENGKRMTTTIGAVYQDSYFRENGCWLIAKRVGDFRWQEKIEADQ